MSSIKFDPQTLDQAALDEALKSLSDYFIPKRRLKISKTKLGSGGFGTVRLAELRSNTLFPILGASTNVAVKELRTDGHDTVPLRIAVRLAREMKVWASCKDQYILQFTGYYLSSDFKRAYLISPYMKNGNVKEYLAKAKPSIDERVILAGQCMDGLAYLHSREPPIIHGDLKPLNVLIDDDYDAVLSDFGLAQAMEDKSTGLSTSNGFKGTIRYCSPEVLMGRPRERESDIWSWACLALEIVTNNPPYHEYPIETQVLLAVCGNDDSRRTPEPSDISSLPHPGLLLLRECWSFEPGQRPGTQQCLIQFLNLALMLTLGEQGCDIRPELLIQPNNIRFLGEAPNSIDLGNRIRFAEILPQGPSYSVVKVRVKTFTDLSEATEYRDKPTLLTPIHKNLLGIVGCFAERVIALEATAFHFMEPCLRNGNLLMYLRARKLESQARLKLLRDILNGLQYLHGSQINEAHGALCPWAVQIDDEGNAMLSDLVYDFSGTRSKFNSPDHCFSLWCSPEVKRNLGTRSAKADMWSWACVVLQVMCEQRPFNGVSIHSQDFLRVPRNPGSSPEPYPEPQLPTRLLELVRKCWRQDPQTRPSARRSLEALELIIQEQSVPAS